MTQHRRCPRCDSPAPHLHPAMQHEGEVRPCSDPFHETVRVKAMLEEFKIPGSPARQRFDAASEKYEKQLKPLMDAVRASERITDEDLRVTITAPDN